MIDKAILSRLNAPTPRQRLNELQKLLSDAHFPETDPRMTNNHVHTIYSFSPYSPTAAVYAAKSEGLAVCGIVDHDSIGGAAEFIEAGILAQMPVTVGMEMRLSMAGTPLENLRTNNPDQIGVSYMTLHAVPHHRIGYLQSTFAPLRQKRNHRNAQMLQNINCLLSMNLSLTTDVLPLSQYENGGSVTERHLMLAVAREMIRRGDVISQLRDIGIALTEKQLVLLSDTDSFYYEYDLLGILKSALIPKVYVPATEECMSLEDGVRLAQRVGGILCYAYLGDVAESVTGDKRAQAFEDAHLPLLFDTLKEAGVQAITYMPTRNTMEQLSVLRDLCQKYKMLQVSGEDINSPRQSFVIEAMRNPAFANLIDATWALIAHENERKKLF